MSLLIAIAWIMAITEVVINVVADILFRIWTLGCHGSTSNWSHNPRNVQLPCGSQQNRHEHGWRFFPNHGLLHMLQYAYGRIFPRHRYRRLLRDLASWGGAVYTIWLTRIY